MTWLVLGWLVLGTSAWAAETNAAPVRRSLVVLPFVNASGDPQADHWMGTFGSMMRRQFQEVTELKVVTGTRTEAELKRWPDQSPSRPWSEERLRQVGERTQAQRVLCGSLRQTNGQWQALAEVFTTATSRRSAPLLAASADWFELRDRLTTLVLKELGLAPTPEEAKRLGRRFTSSAKALESFSLGLHYQGRKVPRALDYFQQAVAADPHFAFARVRLAAMLFSADQIEKARGAVEAALREAPDARDTAACHMILGMCQQEEPEKAEAELRRAQQLAPDEPQVLQAHAQLLAALDAYEPAITCLRQAIELDPENIESQAVLGRLHVAAGQVQEGRRSLQTAEQLAENAPITPDLIDAARNLGDGYWALQDPGKAARYYGLMRTQLRAAGLSESKIQYVKERLDEAAQRLKATPVPLNRPRDYTQAELQAALRERLSEAELARVVNPLEATPALGAWARTLVAGAGDEMARARRLFEALCGRPTLNGHSARTAQEVFAAWPHPEARFNCQEYAKLYVALARSVGLPAYLVIVEKAYDGATVTHACAAVFVEGKAWLVDPMCCWFGVAHQQVEALDDFRAIAGHCSQQEDLPLCQMACKLDPASVVARVNLAGELLSAGRRAEAEHESAWVRQHAPNHWSRWQLEAALAAEHGDWAAVVTSLRKAIALKPNEGELRLLLGEGLFRRRELAEARLELREGLALRHTPPKAAEARHLLAVINEALGAESEPAASVATPPEHPDPQQAESYYVLGRASLRRGSTNLAEAVKWIRKAADLGLAAAQTHWGALLLDGRAVAKDETNAVHWFRQAAEQGDSSAMENLAFAYEHGVGVATDLQQSIAWTRRAAEAGNRQARYNLGLLHYAGKNLPQDYPEAIFWLLLADQTEEITEDIHGHPKRLFPKSVLKELELFATAEQFAAARARLAQFKKDHPAEGGR